MSAVTPYHELEALGKALRERDLLQRQLDAVDRILMWKGTGRGRVESISLLKVDLVQLIMDFSKCDDGTAKDWLASHPPEPSITEVVDAYRSTSILIEDESCPECGIAYQQWRARALEAEQKVVALEAQLRDGVRM